jgi:tRNA-specific 2-thiouridylase
LYVVAIHPTERAVVVGEREELLGHSLRASELNWLADEPPMVGSRLLVQVRHRATPAAAAVTSLDTGMIELALETPIAAITPGQSAVFYEGERVVGGGIIEGQGAMRLDGQLRG